MAKFYDMSAKARRKYLKDHPRSKYHKGSNPKSRVGPDPVEWAAGRAARLAKARANHIKRFGRR